MTERASGPSGDSFGRDGWLFLAVTMSVIATLLSLLSVGFAARSAGTS